MRLLVSVRDADEAATALAGGAEIIDAKEPSAGGLGPVAPTTLRAIRAVVPADVPLSAALGDVRTEAEARLTFSSSFPVLDFAKIGFAGVDDPRLLRRLLAVARAHLSRETALVAVAYADWFLAESLPPEAVAVALPAGVAGLLVDTARKDGSNLFDHLGVDRLCTLHAGLQRSGRWLALGGSLGREVLTAALATGAEICGVRGAVTTGGRNGAIDLARVQALRQELVRQRPAAVSRLESASISSMARIDQVIPAASAVEK